MAESSQIESCDAAEAIDQAPFQLRPAVRVLLLVTIGLAAGVAGIFTGRLLWPHGAAQDNHAPVRLEKPDSGQAATVSTDRVPDPEAPLPDTNQGLIEEATRLIDRLQEAFPDNTDALEMKARFENWRGKSEQAVKIWQRCLELDPQYAHAYVGMADVAAKTGDHEQALQLARKAMEIAPDSFLARSAMAKSQINLGRPDKVAPVLGDFLQRDPRAYGFFLLGHAYAQMKQYEEAKESYAWAVEKYPDYAEAYYGLARASARLGQDDEAAKAVAKYKELMKVRYPNRQGRGMASSDSEWVHRSVATICTDAARVYYARGKRREAERLWRRAAAVDAGNVPCRHALASLYRSEGKVFKTIEVLEDLAKIEPANPSHWIEIGQLRAKLLQPDLAETSLREACRAAPESARCRAALASFLVTTGRDLPHAVATARAAVGLEPSASNQALLAVACRVSGDHAGALAAIDEAVAQEPENPNYRQLQEAIHAEK